MAVLLMTEPWGARLPVGKVTVLGQPALSGAVGTHDDAIGINGVLGEQAIAQALAALGAGPPVEDASQRLAGGGQDRVVEQVHVAEVGHHLGHAAGQEGADGGVVLGTVGKHAHEPRDADVDLVPVVARRPPQPGGEGDRRDVQKQVRRPPERRMDGHGVSDRAVGQDIASRQTAPRKLEHGAGGSSRQVEPDRLAGRCQGGVGDGQAECLGHDLGGGGRAEELAAAARAAARSTAERRGLLQREVAVDVADADRLNFTGVLPLRRRQGDAARHEHARQVGHAGQREHHRGDTLVAGRHADHALAPGQRANQAAEHGGRVVAVGQAVHHPGRALRAAVAGVGDHCGERHHAGPTQLFGGLPHEQADLPVARVVAERDRLARPRREGRPGC